MEMPENRQSRRIKVNLPVEFEQLGDLKNHQESLTRDISASGMRMNTDGYIAPATQLSFKLTLPEVHQVLQGIARIVWSHRISYSDRYQTGLEFCDMNAELKKFLQDYIAHLS